MVTTDKALNTNTDSAQALSASELRVLQTQLSTGTSGPANRNCQQHQSANSVLPCIIMSAFPSSCLAANVWAPRQPATLWEPLQNLPACVFHNCTEQSCMQSQILALSPKCTCSFSASHPLQSPVHCICFEHIWHDVQSSSATM